MFSRKLFIQFVKSQIFLKRRVLYSTSLQIYKHVYLNRIKTLSAVKISYENKCFQYPVFVRRCTTVNISFSATKEALATRQQLKLEEAAKTIYEECLKKDVMIMSFGIEHVMSCLQYLMEMKLPITEAQEFMIESPISFTNQNFYSVTKFLRDYGFSPKQMVSVIKKLPSILDMDFKTVTECLESLRKLGFTDAQLLKLVAYHPSIVLLENKDILIRIAELKALFKSKDILYLIVKSPIVLVEDMSIIYAKFNYVYNEMGITQRQMMYCDLFGHSLEHIRCRHQFLTRSGLYKKIDKDKGEINKNPLLQNIIDTADEEFAKNYAGMTVLEYETFKQMFEEELKQLDEENQYDDNDDDGDDDD